MLRATLCQTIPAIDAEQGPLHDCASGANAGPGASTPGMAHFLRVDRCRGGPVRGALHCPWEHRPMHLSNPALASAEPYVPGLTPDYVAKTYGIPASEVAKLGSAENPFGPSPRAVEAVSAAPNLSNYPDWTARPLREKIAAKYCFSPDQVICGAGETEIISWIIRTFAGLGEKVLMFVPAFPIYHMFAEADGRMPVYVGMGKDLEFNWDAYLEAIRPEVRIAFLTNPHSP